MNSVYAMKQYRQIGVHGRLAEASPHEMVVMLFEGALQRLATGKGAMEQGDVALKGQVLGSAISIVDGLRASLDRRHGGDLVDNLVALYDYIERRILEASLRSDPAILDEVMSLLREIKLGWDAIPKELHRRHD
jgi:flagellar protein FliS